MPGALLVAVSDLEEAGFRARAAHKLKPNWQAQLHESHRYAYGWESSQRSEIVVRPDRCVEPPVDAAVQDGWETKGGKDEAIK